MLNSLLDKKAQSAINFDIAILLTVIDDIVENDRSMTEKHQRMFLQCIDDIDFIIKNNIQEEE